jgi:hypothetical protein
MVVGIRRFPLILLLLLLVQFLLGMAVNLFVDISKNQDFSSMLMAAGFAIATAAYAAAIYVVPRRSQI